MVCRRCVLAVEDILHDVEIPFTKVLFGEVHLINQLSERQKEVLKGKLAFIGFELIDNHLSGLVEKIKAYVIKKRVMT